MSRSSWCRDNRKSHSEQRAELSCYLQTTAGSLFIHPCTDKRVRSSKKWPLIMFSSYHVCLSPRAACDHGIHRQTDSCGSGEKTSGPDWFRAGSHHTVFHKNSREVMEFLLFEGGQNLRPNLFQPNHSFPRHHYLRMGFMRKEKETENTERRRSITTCYRWDNPSAAL